MMGIIKNVDTIEKLHLSYLHVSVLVCAEGKGFKFFVWRTSLYSEQESVSLDKYQTPNTKYQKKLILHKIQLFNWLRAYHRTKYSFK